jgi:hypothetical protein
VGLIDEIHPSLKPEQVMELCDEQPHLLQQFLSRDPERGELIRDKRLPELRALTLRRALRSSKRHFDNTNEMYYV